MIARLVWHDVKQNLKALRILPLFALAMYLAYKDIGLGVQRKHSDVPGALTRYHFWLFYVIPLLAGVMGASLARERRKGITLTLLARGLTPGQYLMSKMLAAAASAACFMLMAIAGFYAIIVVVWLPNREMWRNYNDWTPWTPFFLPVDNLVLHDIFTGAMLILAPAALSLVGVLAGLIVRNEYIAMASPPIFTILLTIVGGEIWDPLTPVKYLVLSYWHGLPDWLIPYAPFLYWGVFSLIIAALCKRIIATRELV